MSDTNQSLTQDWLIFFHPSPFFLSVFQIRCGGGVVVVLFAHYFLLATLLTTRQASGIKIIEDIIHFKKNLLKGKIAKLKKYIGAKLD